MGIADRALVRCSCCQKALILHSNMLEVNRKEQIRKMYLNSQEMNYV